MPTKSKLAEPKAEPGPANPASFADNRVSRFFWPLETQYLWAALFMAALLPVFLGRFSPFLLLGVSALYLVLATIKHKRLDLQLDIIGKVFIGVLVVQVILAAISAQTPGDIAFGLNFVPLLLYPLLTPVIKLGKTSSPVTLFATFALVGALCALAAAFVSITILQNARGDFIFSNVNDLSGLALLFGFLALIGFAGSKTPAKMIFLLGPVFALATIFLTSSRGVLLAYLPLVAVSIWFLVPKRFHLLSLLGALLCLIVLALLAPVERISALPQIFLALANAEFTSDASTNQRLVLYIAGFKAFMQAPWFGHGWANFMQAAALFVPQVPMRPDIVGLPQLHNDLLNFAVTGGVFGVATYLAILAAPLILVRKPGAAQQDIDSINKTRALKMGLVILVTCYAFRGLTDLMIGFEYGTSFYAITLALLVGLLAPHPAFSRQPEPAAPSDRS